MSGSLNDWTSGLNPEQIEAVKHNYGPLLILAGAGSGKTTVLVSRTGRLIAEKVAHPDNIVVLTFTNKAARELKHRVAQKLGSVGEKIWAGTFHSFGLNILRKHHKKINLPRSFGIVDASDTRSIIKQLMKDHVHFDKDNFDPDKVLQKINDLRTGKTFAIDDEYSDMAQMLKPKYLRRLDSLGVVDFEGLLLKPLQLFQRFPEVLEEYQNKIHQLMVDEFQDTNNVQMRFVKHLTGERKNIAVVGDDDQSIYGWRGAEVQNILGFPRQYAGCKVVRLVRNYRSQQYILDAANALIANNKDRHDKKLIASGYTDPGEKPELFVYSSEDEEVEEVLQQFHHFQRKGFKHKDMAVLYRSNSQGALVESVLRREQIPYKITGGGTFFEKKEVKDVLAYIRCAVWPNEVSFRRILNAPSRGVGDKTIETIHGICLEKNLPFYKVAKHWSKFDLAPRVGTALDRTFQQVESLPHRILDGVQSPGENLLGFLLEIGFKDYVLDSYKERSAGAKRWAWVEALSRVLDHFLAKSGRTKSGLKDFIDLMELRDQVEEQNPNEDSVQLMTLHGCKGLEFPVVMILGIEEDIIPHRTLGTDISEERRLFYVGLTRAKQHLVLSRAEKRKRYGKWQLSAPSRFLMELPEGTLIQHNGPHRPVQEGERQSLLSDLYAKLEKNKSPEI